MTIGVTTTVWGTYSRYLPEWITSVAAQERRPDLVTIVDAGADDLRPAQCALDTSGLAHQIITVDYAGMGHARNAAVQATPTEWVMHLDADDMLLPHALADTERLADRADVVAMGAVRDGREVLFPHASARMVLRGRHCCYSASPYRRTLWERAPYRTANDWVDSALWVGFAHQGARFVPTDRPGFVYRTHPDSHSATIAAADKRAALGQLRRLCRRWSP